MDIVQCTAAAFLLIQRVLRHVAYYGTLTIEEKSTILQAVWDLTRAATLANSLESSICQGYSTKT